LSITVESARLIRIDLPVADHLTRERQTMHKAVLVGFLAAGLAAPVAAYAQPAASAAQPATDQLVVIRPAQWIAVGAGAVVGAVLIDAVIPTDFGYIVGGVLGGYLANVWYTGRQIEVHMGNAPKT
jgi:hypothetical protein